MMRACLEKLYTLHNEIMKFNKPMLWWFAPNITSSEALLESRRWSNSLNVGLLPSFQYFLKSNWVYEGELSHCPRTNPTKTDASWLMYCYVSWSIMICIVTFLPLLSVISILLTRRVALKWRGGAKEVQVDTFLISTLKLCNSEIVSSTLDFEISLNHLYILSA